MSNKKIPGPFLIGPVDCFLRGCFMASLYPSEHVCFWWPFLFTFISPCDRRLLCLETEYIQCGHLQPGSDFRPALCWTSDFRNKFQWPGPQFEIAYYFPRELGVPRFQLTLDGLRGCLLRKGSKVWTGSLCTESEWTRWVNDRKL